MTKQSRAEPLNPAKDRTIGPVLLVTPWYKPTVGGVVEVSDRLFRLLNNAGVETHLLVCDGKNPNHHVQADQSLSNVWTCPVPSSGFHHIGLKPIGGMVIRGFQALWQLARFLRSHKMRTVILVYVTESGWPFLALSHVLGIRLMVSVHGNDVIRYTDSPYLLRLLLRGVLRKSEHIIVCADHLGQEVKKILS